ncbi:MAG: hypothetical protein ABSE77_23795 [Acidimicrobiales bacterium]
MPPAVEGRTATIGIDLGGSKIAAGLVGEDGSLRERRVVPTSASRGVARVLTELVELISDLRDRARDEGIEVQCVGVARCPRRLD